MNIGKYIILDDAGAERPILFCNSYRHADMVPAGRVPVSAGAFMIWNDNAGTPKILTMGPSCTLNLDDRPQDAEILRAFLNLPNPHPTPNQNPVAWTPHHD